MAPLANMLCRGTRDFARLAFFFASQDNIFNFQVARLRLSRIGNLTVTLYHDNLKQASFLEPKLRGGTFCGI